MQPSCSAIPPISCTSKWRIPIVRLPVSRTIAKHSGSSSSSDSPSRGALAQRVHPLAQLCVGVVFELGLERVDQRDALLIGLELLRLADVQRAIEQGWGHAPRLASRRHRPCGRRRGAMLQRGGGRRRFDLGQRRLDRGRRGPRGDARRLSRWRLTWRASSSTTRFSECSISGDASWARSVTPFRYSVASATCLSATRGLRSSKISISRRARSETCRATFADRRSSVRADRR